MIYANFKPTFFKKSLEQASEALPGVLSSPTAKVHNKTEPCK